MIYVVLHDYVTIMPIIAIISIISFSIFSQISGVEVSISEQNSHQGWTAHRGYHVGEESRRLDQIGLLVTGICTRCSGRLRWTSMACRESNSFWQWTHLKPNAIGNRLGPSGSPLTAPLLWIAFNWLQFPASSEMIANCADTGSKHDTKRRIRTTLCIVTDRSVAWMCMCTHHGLFYNLNESQPKCRKDVWEIK